VSPTASLSSSVDPAEYRITPSRSSSPSRDGVLPSFFKSKSVETPYYEYKLALNVNSSTFRLVKQNGFTLIFQVKSMPMQHMLTLHMFVRSPHTSPCRNGQRLQRWDDDHDGTITINTTDEEDSIRQSSCFCVFQYMSYCLPCVPYAWLCTQQQHFFLNRKWSESNSHTAYACPNQKLLREIRSVIRGLPPTSCWCGYFLLAFIGNSALLGAYSIEG